MIRSVLTTATVWALYMLYTSGNSTSCALQIYSPLSRQPESSMSQQKNMVMIDGNVGDVVTCYRDELVIVRISLSCQW